VKRYVIDAAEPFIVSINHGDSGGRREYGIREPLGTLTQYQSHALVTPFMASLTHQGGDRAESLQEPFKTVTGAHRGEKALIVPTLVQTGYGERPGQAPRVPGLDKPLGTIVSGGKHALVAAFLAQHNGGMVGHAAGEPLSTITMRGTNQAVIASHLVKLRGTCRDGQPADEPMATASAGGTHIGEVRAFLMKYYGVDQDPRLTEPMHTVTSKDRMALVMVQGHPYVITDIGMRMLTPRELFRAQGFPDDYLIERGRNIQTGRWMKLTKTAQVRMCGNSVSPPVAEALVRAQFGERARTVAA
jgi:DNA (cytosine-5)-methyltransferase 1